MNRTISTATLGVPRIGRRRELKRALEAYWSGRSSQGQLLDVAKSLRAANWREQQALGVTRIPSNDFSLYDHVLDTCLMVGAIPARYGQAEGEVPLDLAFAMARGSQGREDGCCASHSKGSGVSAMEMTKWFDTNYHFIVPELGPDQRFRLSATKPVEHFLEAKALGIHTRPVLMGPVTYLKLAKSTEPGFEPIALLPRLVEIYGELLRLLRSAGADWVQIDEPSLVLDLSPNEQGAFRYAYDRLSAAAPDLKIMVAAYFGGLGDNLSTAADLPTAGLHVDLVRAPDELPELLWQLPQERVLSLGVIDGRNVWRSDLASILDGLESVVAERGGDRIEIAPSCSLLHVPIDLDLEDALDPELRDWLAFAVQKIGELDILAKAIAGGRDSVAAELDASSAAARRRRTSARVIDPAVRERVDALDASAGERSVSFEKRRVAQAQRLGLPHFPTTTIGSFPQTAEVRAARSGNAKGTVSPSDYETFLRRETERLVRWQEEIGLDVLVHGEFERNDMVQYFGEQLSGFAFTRHAWVQSYGSRYVRPPIIFGDVARPAPMTVGWWRFAQDLTERPMKGMLTGPVTILNWSFVRDDQPRAETCRQIALAIRDEVLDLERAGAAIIQIDEAALREGLPLRRKEWSAYLDWAVECFRLSSGGVGDATQIHTHMCYSEFNDIIEAIAAMDADVISIETSRSRMELLDAFETYRYPNEIGPGVYDIHSPRVPAREEMTDLLGLALRRLSPDQVWVNPDCGLKTRGWDEVRAALVAMVEAAREMRSATAPR